MVCRVDEERASISGASSNAHDIIAGVPQGSILGLFKLFTSDMSPGKAMLVVER